MPLPDNFNAAAYAARYERAEPVANRELRALSAIAGLLEFFGFSADCVDQELHGAAMDCADDADDAKALRQACKYEPGEEEAAAEYLLEAVRTWKAELVAVQARRAAFRAGQKVPA